MKLSNDTNALKVMAGLIVAGLLLFGASFNDPFHFDDVLILKDSNVTNPARWHHFLNPLHLRQLTFFSFYLNYLAGGESPVGFHVVNVALHIANASLLFGLLSRFVERWAAIAAAAIFLAHPIQTEPVLYVYQRSILLACFFSLLGLIAFTERRYGLAAVFFFFGFESKESAIAVPLALALLHDHRYRVAMASAVIILGVAALGVLAYWEEATVGVGVMDSVSPSSYFLTQTRVMYTYLRLLVWPYPQSLEYEFHAFWPVPQIFGLAWMILGGWFLATRERWRVPGLCVLAFFILLAPTSSFIPSADAAFEHRLYLPMLAFALFAASVLSRLPRRTWIAAAIVPMLAALTIQRGTVWASDVALWEDAAKHAPRKARVWFNLGGAHLQSDPDRARPAFLRALELRPEFPEAFYNLGVIEQKKENWSGALAFYERAVEQDPGYWPAWNNMGNTLASVGQDERALGCFQRTLRLNPDYWPAQYNIAVVHFKSGRFDQAIPKLRIVLDWRPDYRDARQLLAIALGQVGYRRAADEEWKKLGGSGLSRSTADPATISAPSRP